jgi:hypothetical protein
MKDVNIPWVKVGDRLPTNAGEVYQGQPDTPFIPVLVFACSPGFPQVGVIVSTVWDTRKSCFIKNDWVLEDPYVITHFIEYCRIIKPE